VIGVWQAVVSGGLESWWLGGMEGHMDRAREDKRRWGPGGFAWVEVAVALAIGGAIMALWAPVREGMREHVEMHDRALQLGGLNFALGLFAEERDGQLPDLRLEEHRREMALVPEGDVASSTAHFQLLMRRMSFLNLNNFALPGLEIGPGKIQGQPPEGVRGVLMPDDVAWAYVRGLELLRPKSGKMIEGAPPLIVQRSTIGLAWGDQVGARALWGGRVLVLRADRSIVSMRIDGHGEGEKLEEMRLAYEAAVEASVGSERRVELLQP
jgi:hypothetical protein